MITSRTNTTVSPALHVFEQDGGWHWGITIARAGGSGFRVVAFSERIFPAEGAARAHGQRALINLGASDVDAPFTNEAAQT
jgi:hypothetical protein